MQWIFQYRLLWIVASLYFLTSCDSASTPSSASFGNSQISLTAPAMLTRAVDPGALFAEVILTYSFDSRTISRTETASRSGISNTWNLALNVPANTEFTIVITWYDTVDPQRVNLTTLTRTVSAGAASSQITLVFDFSEYDSAAFNLDGDAYTNLEERNNGTSPFTPDGTLIEDPIFRYEENQEYTFSRLETEMDGTSIIQARWKPLPYTLANSETCKTQTGFDILLAETSLEEACSTSENCSLTFDQVNPDPQTESSIGFSVAIPPLKASVGVAYELEELNNAQETTATRYLFCLIAINEAPVAANDNFTVTAGIPLIITADQGVNLLSNDTDDLDVSNEPLSINTTPASGPERATIFTLQSDGGFTYLYEVDPANSGTNDLSDSFEYIVSDGTFTSRATVLLDIVVRDQPPELISAIPAQSAVVGIGLSFDLSEFFEDPENSELSFSAATGTLPPSGGVLVSEVGILSGAAQPGDEGTYSVEIEARDQESSVTAILALEVIENQRPIANSLADVGPVESGELISVNVSQSFSDPEEQPLRFTLESSPASALQINPASGLITGRIADAGVYKLSVSANDGISEPVSSSFTVTQNAPAVAILSAITPESLSLSSLVNESVDGSIGFTNEGNALLNFTASSNQSWLTATPASGNVAIDGSQNVTVTAQCGEGESTRSGTLTIGGNGGTQSVSVSLDCTVAPEPILSVEPLSLSLNARVNQSSEASLDVSNVGNALLNFTVSSNQSWLTATPASGNVAIDGSQNVTVTAQCGEGESTQSGSLSFGGNGGPQSVPVSIDCTVAPVPILRVDPGSLSLDARLNQRIEASLDVSNVGNALLNFTVSSNQSWLTATPASGNVAIDGSQNVTVTAQCGEGESTQSGSLSFGGNGGPQSVPVSINCTRVPLGILRVDPESLTLSAQRNESAESSINLENVGNAPLNYKIDGDQPWLKAATVSGTIAATDTLSIGVTGTCGDSVTTLKGSLFINDEDKTVAVELNCRGAVIGNVDPEKFDLTATYRQPAQDQLSFSNTGNETLNFTVSSDSDWLCPDELEFADCQGTDTVNGQLPPQSTYDLRIAGKCLEDTDSTENGILTISGNFSPILVNVSLVCTATPVSEYSELRLNTPASGSLTEEEPRLYYVKGANYILLQSNPGFADLAVYSDESRNNLLCQSTNGESRYDHCELSGDDIYYIEVYTSGGSSDVSYSVIAAFAEDLKVDSEADGFVLKGDSNFYRVIGGAYEINLGWLEGGDADLYVFESAIEYGSESEFFDSDPLLACASANENQPAEICSSLAGSDIYYVQVTGIADTTYELDAISYETWLELNPGGCIDFNDPDCQFLLSE